MSLLYRAEDLLVLIKETALAAVNAKDLLEVRYGTVSSENPLKITVDAMKPLGIAHLELTRNVTDYEVEMSVNGGAKQLYKVFNGLKKDEKVLLLRKQGGGKYIVVDRV